MWINLSITFFQLTVISQADIGCAAVSVAEGNAKAEGKQAKQEVETSS